MKMKRFEPSAFLSPYVKSFMIIESETGTASRILPDTSIILAFKLNGEISQTFGKSRLSLPSAMLSGLRNQIRIIDYERKTEMLLVAFREGGAGAFFPAPLNELFGKGLPLGDLLPKSKVAETEEKLGEAKTDSERIKTVERFLFSELKQTEKDLLIYKAVSQIKRAGGDIKVKDLVKYLYASRDPFEKRFRRVVGTSPKQFSNIVRLRNLINRRSPEKSLTELAFESGYFDQAHFIKEFKNFTGESPRRFFESKNFW